MLAPTIGAALLFLCLFYKHHEKAYCQQSAGKPDRADGKNVCQQRAKPGAEREQADHAEYVSALCRIAISRVWKYAQSASVPLRMLPMHMVLA